MMTVPHVHRWPEEAVSNEEAIGPQDHLTGVFTCVSPKASRHVCSTCETEIQTEEDVPRETSVMTEYVTSTPGASVAHKRGHLGTVKMEEEVG